MAFQIEARLSKEEIFELYVNRVFLGHRAYGFEAAAETYYGKPLAELTLAQHAMLAGVPKAPSRNNPLSNPEKGKIRRDWILGRMANLGMINETEQLAAAIPPSPPLFTGKLLKSTPITSPRWSAVKWSSASVMPPTTTAMSSTPRLKPNSTGRPRCTAQRTENLRLAHGWRGPERRLAPREGESPEETLGRWQEALRDMPTIAELPPGIVTAVGNEAVSVLLKSGNAIALSWEGDLERVRQYRSVNQTAAPEKTPAALLAPGDLIRVRETDQGWRLTQVPKAQSALVSLDPKHGAIRAIVGGMGFELSKFNRATQAKRQPGSNFKPFLYASALEAGITPSTVINDAPVVLDNLSAAEIWRPENDSGKFYGPTRLREALTFSRNLVSIRVLQRVGVRRFIRYVEGLGFDTEAYRAI